MQEYIYASDTATGIADVRAAIAAHKAEVDAFRRVGVDNFAFAAACECEFAEQWLGIQRAARRAGDRARAAYETARAKAWEHLTDARMYMVWVEPAV